MQEPERRNANGAAPPASGPACKCCGGPTREFGRVDAARSCEDARGAPFPPAGHDVLYRRCDTCGFVFTTDFDKLTDAGMAEAIYNDQYILADPEFAELRPGHFARVWGAALAPLRQRLRIVDYGGGSGRFAALMREAGFDARTVDPYFAKEEAEPGSASLVTAFEVVEHSRTPLATFREALAYLQPGGVLLFSTAVRPDDAGIDFPYIAPRNGHVSIHSEGSLRACAAALGMRRLSPEEGLHLFVPATGAVAEVGRHLLRQRAGAILYESSRRSPRALAEAWLDLARITGMARWKALLDPRHPLRALRRRTAGA